MKSTTILLLTLLMPSLVFAGWGADTQASKDAQAVQRQQAIYAKSQPVPGYKWSLERHLLIQLYNIRNMKAVTHSVWRSNYGMIEGDCASMGFGIPYDTSLTNPVTATDEDPEGYEKAALATIEQAEPNGIFASKNTNATWVMCVNKVGVVDPVYVETKVTVYPYPVKVDYAKNRVTKSGKSTVTIDFGK